MTEAQVTHLRERTTKFASQLTEAQNSELHFLLDYAMQSSSPSVALECIYWRQSKIHDDQVDAARIARDTALCAICGIARNKHKHPFVQNGHAFTAVKP